jgi:hypothetical protein
MPENQAADFISQGDYDTYIGNWLALVASTDATALPKAFQVPEVSRINFLNFSIDQVTALTAPDVALLKARFLAIPDDSKTMRFSTALFGLDADGKRLTEYYVPMPPQAGGSTTEPTGSGTSPNPHITRKDALEWLTAWVDASAVTASLFSTPNGPLRGYNFGVSTLKDPLAAAQPTDGKGLFLNLGLHHDPTSPQIPQTLDLVLYINMLGSRTQGTLAGLPEDDSYYNGGHACPPQLMMS